MRYECDYCPTELPEGYVPEVDARDRPVQAVCQRCKADQMRGAEARRNARLAMRRDLLDEFAEVLRTQIQPRMGH